MVFVTKSLRQIKKVVIFVVGMTVLLFGIALLVLPGPAFLVIPAGLAILSVEFAWAKHWLHKARGIAARAADKVRGRKKAEPS
jgi:tellurite resistance protein TerC